MFWHISGGIGSVNLAGFIEAQGHYSGVVYGVEKIHILGYAP